MEKPKRSTRKTQPIKPPELVRLNKFISDAGIASRRKADELIEQGSVKVNGQTCMDFSYRVHPEKDKVQVKGRLIRPELKLKKYFMFNKPKQVLTTMSDDKGRTTVADYFAKVKFKLHPVGRLDWDSEGLLLMTNDGDFTQEVIHPRSQILKTYIAKVDGQPTEVQLEKLKKGVSILGGKARAHHVSYYKRGTSEKYAWIKIAISEGKNRQIRRMFEKIGYDVLKLQRISIGALPLGGLKPGHYRELSVKELLKIFGKPKNESPQSPPLKKTKKRGKPPQKSTRLKARRTTS